jgi:cell wall-associated NlpC family hydrolase
MFRRFAIVVFFLASCGTEEQRPRMAPAPVAVATTQTPQAAAAALAASLVGAPYRFGGAAPDGFDCSGLVWYVYRAVGVTVPRTAAEQRNMAAPVEMERLKPGDLVFFQTPVDHVGIYLGDGEFVHAPSSGRTVERARLKSPFFLLGFAGAGRPTA